MKKLLLMLAALLPLLLASAVTQRQPLALHLVTEGDVSLLFATFDADLVQLGPAESLPTELPGLDYAQTVSASWVAEDGCARKVETLFVGELRNERDQAFDGHVKLVDLAQKAPGARPQR